MLLKAIRFQNYRAFREATLPLNPLTLLIGPNGSGKTSALSAIKTFAGAANGQHPTAHTLMPVGIESSPTSVPSLQATWDNGPATRLLWPFGRSSEMGPSGNPEADAHIAHLKGGRLFAFDPIQIAAPVPLTKTLEVHENGSGLPAVLTTLQDQWPERFEALNHDLRRWLPEFNRVLFDTPSQGTRAIALRTAEGGHSVPTTKLSAGTLLSLSLLTIAHVPSPPTIIGLEEPDYGIHPRLLRELKESLLRLTDPSAFGDQRTPVQVILTTHSPYLVDLFRDELDSVVVTRKMGLYSTFTRMIDLPHAAEIVKDASLGEAWYSGILGGVPVEA
jgi:predicted ATPase